MSEEIERRVEASLLADDITGTIRTVINAATEAMLGGRHNLDLFVRLSDFIFFSEKATGKKWNEDAATRDRVLKDLRSALPYALAEAGKTELSLTEQLEERERKFADIRSRVVKNDPEENVEDGEKHKNAAGQDPA